MGTDFIHSGAPIARAASFLVCEWDVTRMFGMSDIGERGLGSGWSHPEESHAWNDGFDATLNVVVEEGYGDAAVVIEGEPYVVPAHPKQDVTIYINGHRAGFWRLTGRGENVLRVDIAPEWWVTRDEQAVLKVVVHLPDSVRPADIGIGDDGRRLGFCFRGLRISRT